MSTNNDHGPGTSSGPFSLGGMGMDERQLRGLIKAVLEEEHKIASSNAEKIARAAVEQALLQFGINADDKAEVKKDFSHLRRWRRGVDQARTMTFKATIATLVSGFFGLMVMIFKSYVDVKFK